MKRTILIAISAAFITGILSQILPVSAQDKPGTRLRRLAGGDANGDGVRDISDTIYMLNWLFAGGPEPVKPEGDDPPAEVLLQIQASAEAALASLPSEERIAKFPRRISNGFLLARTVFASAAANAPSWGMPEIEQYAVAVRWVAVFVGSANLLICKIFPEQCVDQDCLDRCDDAYDACMNGCPSSHLDPLGYSDCMINCSTAAVECADKCLHP